MLQTWPEDDKSANEPDPDGDKAADPDSLAKKQRCTYGDEDGPVKVSDVMSASGISVTAVNPSMPMKLTAARPKKRRGRFILMLPHRFDQHRRHDQQRKKISEKHNLQTGTKAEDRRMHIPMVVNMNIAVSIISDA